MRDHLDYLDAAQIRAESGVYALLGLYVNAPRRGIDVYIGEKSNYPAQDLAEVLEAIGDANARVIGRDPNL